MYISVFGIGATTSECLLYNSKVQSITKMFEVYRCLLYNVTLTIPTKFHGFARFVSVDNGLGRNTISPWSQSPNSRTSFSRKSSALQSCNCNNGTWRNRWRRLWCPLCTGNGSPSAKLSPVMSPPRSTDKAQAVAQSYWYHLNPFDACRHVTSLASLWEPRVVSIWANPSIYQLGNSPKNCFNIGNCLLLLSFMLILKLKFRSFLFII